MKQVLSFTIFVPLFSLAQVRSIPIHIHLTGMPEGSFFYINENKRNIDSGLSKAGMLEFSYLKKSAEPQGLLLISKDRKFGYVFWVEDNPLELKGIYGNLSPLSAEGSIAQNEFIEYMELTQPVEKLIGETKFMIRKSKLERTSDSTTFELDLEQLKKSLKNKNKTFIESHPKSIISTYALLLETTRKSFSTEESLSLFNKLGHDQQNSFYGQSVLKSLQSFKNPKIGGQAPSFSMNDLNGKLVSLGDYKGRNIVLVFWASWCVPCRKEIPEIKKAIQDFKGKNFLFIAVSHDQDKDAWLKAIQADNVSWINVSDLKGWANEVALTYGVTAIPDHFLIDDTGRTVERSGQFSVIKNKMSELSLKQ
jgi:peroxiredoxin